MLHTSLCSLLCGTDLYSFNKYITILTTILPNMQLFVYYNDRFISTAMLFSLQCVYQLHATGKQHKHTHFYVFNNNVKVLSVFNSTISNILQLQGVLHIITVTSNGFMYAIWHFIYILSVFS